MEEHIVAATSAIISIISMSFALMCAKKLNEKDSIISRMMNENKNLRNRIEYYESLIDSLRRKQ